MSTQTGALRWGGVIRLSTRELRVEPANWVGGVVQLEDGRWEVVLDADERFLRGSRFSRPRHFCTPLLPPAALLSPGERCWSEALQALALLPGASTASGGYWTDEARIQGEAGLWHWKRSNITFNMELYYHQYHGNAENYDARGRDHQKEGTLRAWLTSLTARAQEGNDE